MDLTVYVNYS